MLSGTATYARRNTTEGAFVFFLGGGLGASVIHVIFHLSHF